MKKFNLVFMGDSLTAGVYSDGKLDYSRNSYPDFIKQYFEKKKHLNSFYNIAVSGFTSKDLLNLLSKDYTYNENVAYNITPEPSYRKYSYKQKNTAILLTRDIKINKIIKNADIITMTIGNNDIIKYLNSYKGNLKVLDIKEFISSNHEATSALLKVIIDNFTKIINYIQSINSNCKIIFIGSYTPNKFNLVHKIVDRHLETIENTIFNSITDISDQIYIMKIRENVSKNKELYLDNIFDIHLNEEGYKMIANEFIEFINDKKLVSKKYI